MKVFSLCGVSLGQVSINFQGDLINFVRAMVGGVSGDKEDKFGFHVSESADPGSNPVF